MGAACRAEKNLPLAFLAHDFRQQIADDIGLRIIIMRPTTPYRLVPGFVGDVERECEQGLRDEILGTHAAMRDEGVDFVGEGRVKPVEDRGGRDISG